MRSGNLAILIAEDDIDDREFIKDAFQRNCNSCEIQFVHNGLELADELRMKYDAVPPGLPSVILLDLNMPLKNGYQSLQDIKRTPALSGIPVIIVTSSANQKDEADCMKLGCNKFFNKPFSLQGYDELINKILATLGQTRN